MADHRVTNYITTQTRGIRFLHRPGGGGLLHSITSIFDSVLADASLAVSEGMLDECSDAALDYQARNSNDRRVTGEGNPALRGYLQTRWDRHKEAGTEDGLLFQLQRLGYPNVELWSWERLKLAGVPGATAFGGRIGFWFLLIRQPHPFTDAPVWNDGGEWDDERYWGGLATGDLADRLSDLDYTLHRWRPSGRSPRFVVIDMDGTTQVKLTPPYDFDGNYTIFPFFEKIETRGGRAPTPFFSSSFVTP